MMIFIDILMFILISIGFIFITTSVPNEHAKINKRIDCLITNQHKIFKYHIIGILSQMRNSRRLAIMQEDYELANSIQEDIKGIEEVLKEYEEKTNS